MEFMLECVEMRSFSKILISLLPLRMWVLYFSIKSTKNKISFSLLETLDIDDKDVTRQEAK